MKNHSLAFKLALLLVLGLFVISGVQASNAESDTDLKTLAEKSIEVINTGNMELAAEVYSPTIKLHLVDQVKPLAEGLEPLNQYGNFLRTAYPDMKFVATDIMVSGDKIITVTNFTGTNTGPRGGMPPTGKKVDFSGVLISHVVDGKITEQWAYTNMASLYRQLGFTITPPSAEE
jgi:predicted ester cyclase